MKVVLPAIFHIIAALLTLVINRRIENKQDRRLYVALMIGGFVWSQLQTEYLIWRIKRNTIQTCK